MNNNSTVQPAGVSGRTVIEEQPPLGGAYFVCQLAPLRDQVLAVGVVAAPTGTVTLTATADGSIALTGRGGDQSLTVCIEAEEAEGTIIVRYHELRQLLAAIEGDTSVITLLQRDQWTMTLEVEGEILTLDVYDADGHSALLGSIAMPTAALRSILADELPYAGTCAVDVGPESLTVSARHGLTIHKATYRMSQPDVGVVPQITLPMSPLARIARSWEDDILTLGWGWCVSGRQYIALRCGQVTAHLRGVCDDGLRWELSDDRTLAGPATADRRALLTAVCDARREWIPLRMERQALVVLGRTFAIGVAGASGSMVVDNEGLQDVLSRLACDQVEFRVVTNDRGSLYVAVADGLPGGALRRESLVVARPSWVGSAE